jgi:DNA-binding response OmpR family regulator/DNA-binding CsgD family transcriptional regulator
VGLILCDNRLTIQGIVKEYKSFVPGYSLPKSGERSFSILLIDEASSLVETVTKPLRHNGFQTYVAENGPSIRRQLKRRLPDLILINVESANGVDGVDAWNRIRAIPGCAALPIILLTEKPVAQFRGFEVGAVDYLIKPIDMDELIVRVNAYLRLEKTRFSLEETNRRLEKEIDLRRIAHSSLQRSLDRAVIVAFRRKEWSIHFRTQIADVLLRKHFSHEYEQRFSEQAEAWAQSPLENAVVAGHNGELLSVRTFRDPDHADLAVFFLSESCCSETASIRILKKHLGLTERESEVLFWIAQGKTSPEIGIILDAATTTVKKHVQNILSKLELENRLSAALLANELLSDHLSAASDHK